MQASFIGHVTTLPSACQSSSHVTSLPSAGQSSCHKTALPSVHQSSAPLTTLPRTDIGSLARIGVLLARYGLIRRQKPK